MLVSAEPLKRVLLLHSYHSGYKWTDDITSAVYTAFARLRRVDLRVEYLDAKRYASAEHFTLQKETLGEKYSYTRFDLIICVDNTALFFLLANRTELFPDVPIVFSGINSYRARMIAGQANITGVAEQVDARKTVDLMLALHPQTSRITVVNDHTVSGTILNQEIQQLSKQYPHISWSFPEFNSFEEMQSLLSSLQKGELVLLGVFDRDINNRPVEYDEAATIFATSSKVPIYGLWDYYLGYGIVGGYLASGTSQGATVAGLALRILAGTPVDMIPVVTESPNHYFADYRAAQRFGLQPTQFPVDTVFVNRPIDFYETYKREIRTALVLLIFLSLLSLFLFITVLKKRRIEKELRNLTLELESRVEQRTEALSAATEEITQRQQQMQHLLSNLSGMAYRCKNDSKWTMIFVSEGAVALTGYSPEGLMNNRDIAFGDLIDDRDTATVDEAVALAIERQEHFAIEYRIHSKEGVVKWVWEQGLAVYDDDGTVIYLDGFITDISDRKRYEMEQAKLATAVHQTDDIILITDLAGTIEYVNPSFSRKTGFSAAEAIGKTPKVLNSGKQSPELYENMWRTIQDGLVWRGRLVNRRKDGSEYIAEVTISPIRNKEGEYTHYAGVQRDITNETVLEKNLRQAQKLEALGTLAGGIAHEINSPAQFVSTNLSFIIDSFSDLGGFLDACLERIDTTTSTFTEGAGELLKLYEDNDIDFLREEIPQALQQSQEGVARISHIVSSMKQFALPGDENKTATDLNEALKNTVTVASNEWKYVAELILELDPSLPLVECHRSDVNQVFLNLIVNAAHAIEKTGKNEQDKGTITITTEHHNKGVEIRIADNGSGIPDSIRERVFDPFFTTKEPGKGTGQGLAVAHTLIVDKHGGELFFHTQVDQGTTFVIRLPQFAPDKEQSLPAQGGGENEPDYSSVRI